MEKAKNERLLCHQRFTHTHTHTHVNWNRSRKDHINMRILHSGPTSKAQDRQDKEDSRNHVLLDPYVCVVFGAFMETGPSSFSLTSLPATAIMGPTKLRFLRAEMFSL